MITQIDLVCHSQTALSTLSICTEQSFFRN